MARPSGAGTALLALAATVAATPQRGAPADAALEALAAAAGQGAPLLRIGLTAGAEVSVEGDRPFRIVDPATGEPVWRAAFEGEIHVVAEGAPRGGVGSIYRVQVGAFRDAPSAEAERARLERLVGTPGVVHHDVDRDVWRVRMGRAADRLELSPLVQALARAGIEGAWIAEEPGAPPQGVTLRLVDAAYQSFPTGLTRLVAVPAGEERLRVSGKPYHGVIELRVGAQGTVQPIDWIELEQYLLGVVPAELGPEMWPQLAALEAQAVAARTYAWRHRGQFAEEGYDLCSTPRCQVYEGAGAEHPLSDRAVWDTRGQVVTWEGSPIVALYTATCGGHTEDGKEIFPENDEPYLKGVPCRAEKEALDRGVAALAGRAWSAVLDETGADVTRDWMLLSTAGIVEAAAAPAPVDAARLRGFTKALCRLAGIAEPEGEATGPLTLAAALARLVRETGWAARATVLVSSEDVPGVLRDADTRALPREELEALAYLVSVDALRPFADGRFHADRSATSARLAPALARIAESYEALGLTNGTVASVDRRGLSLQQGKGMLRRPLADGASLLDWSGGRSIPRQLLDLWPGDRVSYRLDPAGAIDFLEVRPPLQGLSDDRSSRLFTWEVRRTRRELEETIERHLALGRLTDLRVKRRGVSGRIVELEIVGEKGSTVVRGFDVRRLLDLRESLVVLELQRDRGGRLEAVVFAGKGWGHGVGLCQVGAFGMAQRGKSYREILAHYYPGTRVDTLSAERP